MHYISSPMLAVMLMLSMFLGFYLALHLSGTECAYKAGANTRAIFTESSDGETK